MCVCVCVCVCIYTATDWPINCMAHNINYGGLYQRIFSVTLYIFFDCTSYLHLMYILLGNKTMVVLHMAF